MQLRGLSAGEWLFYMFCGILFLMPMGTTPFTILGICLLGLWICSGEFLRKGKAYLHEEWFFPVVALISMIWLGLIWSPEPFGLGFKYAKKTHYWIFTFAISSISMMERPKEALIKAFLGGLLLNAMVALFQVGHIVPRFSQWGSTGYTGFYGGYNTLAILLVLGVMIASFYFRYVKEKRGKLFYGSLILIYFFHLMILEGRGGYLTLAILSPVIIHNILNGKNFPRMLLIYLLIPIIMFFFPVVRDRVAKTKADLIYYLNADDDITWGKRYSENIDRIYMWRWAAHLFMENPIIGFGTGGYRKAILDAGGEKGIDHPHNNFLYIAVSFGIVGLFIFCWLFWVIFKAGWRNKESPLGFFILSSSLVILVGGLTDTHILDAGGAFLFAITTGLISVLPKSLPNRYLSP